jgi:hypothetical protein
MLAYSLERDKHSIDLSAENKMYLDFCHLAAKNFDLSGYLTGSANSFCCSNKQSVNLVISRKAKFLHWKKGRALFFGLYYIILFS